MTEVLLSLVVVGGLAFGPLAWRLAKDRAEARALGVRAAILATVNRALGGESLVSVQVTPKSLRRPGRVLLSGPTWLLDRVWLRVLERMPAGYELVVGRDDRSSPPVPSKRAA